MLMLRYMTRGDLDAGLALRDERKDLRFPVGEALAASRPIHVQPALAASDRFDRGHCALAGLDNIAMPR